MELQSINGTSFIRTHPPPPLPIPIQQHQQTNMIQQQPQPQIYTNGMVLSPHHQQLHPQMDVRTSPHAQLILQQEMAAHRQLQEQQQHQQHHLQHQQLQPSTDADIRWQQQQQQQMLFAQQQYHAQLQFNLEQQQHQQQQALLQQQHQQQILYQHPPPQATYHAISPHGNGIPTQSQMDSSFTRPIHRTELLIPSGPSSLSAASPTHSMMTPTALPSPSRLSLTIQSTTEPSTTSSTFARRPPIGSSLLSPHNSMMSPRTIYKPAEVCLTSDHELLTKRGWIPIQSIHKGEEVWSIQTPLSEELQMGWSLVTETHQLDAPSELIHLQGSSLNCIATPAHRWPVRSTAHADPEKSTMMWEWRRTDELDSSNELIAIGTNSNQDYQWEVTDIPYLSLDATTIPSWCTKLSQLQAGMILKDFMKQHGSIASTELERDFIQIIGLMSGYQVTASELPTHHDDASSPKWNLHLIPSSFISLDSTTSTSTLTSLLNHSEKFVYCVTVTNGNFYTRRNDGRLLCPLFTGNCKSRPEQLYQPPQCFSPLTSTPKSTYAFPGLLSTVITKTSPLLSSTQTAANLYSKTIINGLYAQSQTLNPSLDNNQTYDDEYVEADSGMMNGDETIQQDEDVPASSSSRGLFSELFSAATGADYPGSRSTNKSKQQSSSTSAPSKSAKLAQGTNASSKARRVIEENEPQQKRKYKPRVSQESTPPTVPTGEEEQQMEDVPQPSQQPQPPSATTSTSTSQKPPTKPRREKPAKVTTEETTAANTPDTSSTVPSAATIPPPISIASPKPKEKKSSANIPSPLSTPTLTSQSTPILPSPLPKVRQTRTSMLASSNEIVEELAKSIEEAKKKEKKHKQDELTSSKEEHPVESEVKQETKVKEESSSAATAATDDASMKDIDVQLETSTTTVLETIIQTNVKTEVVTPSTLDSSAPIDTPMETKPEEELTPSAPAPTKADKRSKSKQSRRSTAAAVPTTAPSTNQPDATVAASAAPATTAPSSTNGAPASTSTSGAPSTPSRGRGRPPKGALKATPQAATTSPETPPITPPSSKPSSRATSPVNSSKPTAEATTAKPSTPDEKSTSSSPSEMDEETRLAELRKAELANEKFIAKYLTLYDQTQSFANSTGRTRHQATANATPAETVLKKGKKKKPLMEKEFNPNSVIKQIKQDMKALAAQQLKAKQEKQETTTASANSSVAAGNETKSDTKAKHDDDASSTIESVTPSTASGQAPAASGRNRSRAKPDEVKENVLPSNSRENGSNSRSRASKSKLDEENDDEEEEDSKTNGTGDDHDSDSNSDSDSDDYTSSSEEEEDPKPKKRLSELDRLHLANQFVFHAEEKDRRRKLRQQKKAAKAAAQAQAAAARAAEKKSRR